jgi:hypothetical protein
MGNGLKEHTSGFFPFVYKFTFRMITCHLKFTGFAVVTLAALSLSLLISECEVPLGSET